MEPSTHITKNQSAANYNNLSEVVLQNPDPRLSSMPWWSMEFFGAPQLPRQHRKGSIFFGCCCCQIKESVPFQWGDTVSSVTKNLLAQILIERPQSSRQGTPFSNLFLANWRVGIVTSLCSTVLCPFPLPEVLTGVSENQSVRDVRGRHTKAS